MITLQHIHDRVWKDFVPGFQEGVEATVAEHERRHKIHTPVLRGVQREPDRTRLRLWDDFFEQTVQICALRTYVFVDSHGHDAGGFSRVEEERLLRRAPMTLVLDEEAGHLLRGLFCGRFDRFC